MTLVNPSVSSWLSYPSQWTAKPVCLSVSLMVVGQRVPACALHPGSSKAPLQATCGWLAGQPSELGPLLAFPGLPSPGSTDLPFWLLFRGMFHSCSTTGLQQMFFEYLLCTQHLQVLGCRPSQLAEAHC